MDAGKVSLEDIKLNTTEAQTALWLKISSAAEVRLATLRERNDNTMPESETAKLRGRIAELKVLLALVAPGPAETPDADE